MPSLLITNANSGEGLVLAKLYANAGWEVIAVNARPFSPRDYAQLGYDIRELRYDLSKEGAIADFKTRLGAHPLDLVILTLPLSLEGADAADLTSDAFEEILAQNTLAPALLVPTLAENLQKGSGKKLVLISSAAASMAAEATAQGLAQKASLAALHQVLRSLAVEWRALDLCVAVLAAQGPAAMAAIEGLTLEQSAQFLTQEREALAW